jgi:hypothetical protein
MRVASEVHPGQCLPRTLSSIVQRESIDSAEGLALGLAIDTVLHNPLAATAFVHADAKTGEGIIPGNEVWFPGRELQ